MCVALHIVCVCVWWCGDVWKRPEKSLLSERATMRHDRLPPLQGYSQHEIPHHEPLAQSGSEILHSCLPYMMVMPRCLVSTNFALPKTFLP